MTIEAEHYDEARRILRDDPIVQDMARGLAGTNRSFLAHDNGTPRFEFMNAANREYAARGGTHQAHIGAVAEALLLILSEET